MPWRNFLSPEFKTKFQREVPLFLEITEFPFNSVGPMEGNSHAKNQLYSFIRFDRTPTCDGRTDRHRTMASTADAQHRAVKRRQQTRGNNYVNSQPIFKFFTVKFYSKFAAKYLLKIPPHLICVAAVPCETLMSENERQSQTNHNHHLFAQNRSWTTRPDIRHLQLPTI